MPSSISSINIQLSALSKNTKGRRFLQCLLYSPAVLRIPTQVETEKYLIKNSDLLIFAVKGLQEYLWEKNVSVLLKTVQ